MLLIVATEHIYNKESEEDGKWIKIAKLYNANKSRGQDLKSEDDARNMYMRLVSYGDDVWRDWKDLKHDDEKVKKVKEGIKDKLWEKPPHVSDNWI